MKKGKAQYERDDVQEGEEAGSPNAKKSKDSSQPLPLRSFYAGLLKVPPMVCLWDGAIPLKKGDLLPNTKAPPPTM
jgi:hypothetical protein